MNIEREKLRDADLLAKAIAFKDVDRRLATVSCPLIYDFEDDAVGDAGSAALGSDGLLGRQMVADEVIEACAHEP